VLIRPRARFPRARTAVAVLDARRLRVRTVRTLEGDFSFDALSPDGASMYLIEYRSRRDPTRYAVRLYDLRAGRLVPAPVVDPREPDERMRGYPITRATSADGRWHYTLYDGAGGHPFVHALDTEGRTAACIDLDALAGVPDLFRLRLALERGGRELVVLDRGAPVATVDLATFRVRTPGPAPARTPGPARGGGGAPPWTLAIPVAAALLALAAALRLQPRRGNGDPPEARADEDVPELVVSARDL
jgi:hypothetical protein